MDFLEECRYERVTMERYRSKNGRQEVLEYCNLDSFVPKGLGKLRRLSLMGNQIPNMNMIRMDFRDEDSGKKHLEEMKQDNDRIVIPDVSLETLNLSNNHFESFPWVAIHEMDNLTELNMGRNRMTQMIDP